MTTFLAGSVLGALTGAPVGALLAVVVLRRWDARTPATELPLRMCWDAGCRDPDHDHASRDAR